MPRSTLARRFCLVLASTAACAPAISEQVARGEWYDACRRDKDFDSQAEFERALLRELASSVTLGVEVLDAPALARELGAPVEGELAARVLVVRFVGQLSAPRLHAARVHLAAVSDGERSFATRRGNPLAISGREEANLYDSLDPAVLSEVGVSELLLATNGAPGYPDALKPRLVDDVPVPLGGGTTVGTLRERHHTYAVEKASRERDEWRAARVAAMRSDAVLGPAATRLRERLAAGEWLLLRPGQRYTDTAITIAIEGDIAGDDGAMCRVGMTVSVALAGGADPLVARVKALFGGGARPLTTLPWRLVEWRGG